MIDEINSVYYLNGSDMSKKFKIFKAQKNETTLSKLDVFLSRWLNKFMIIFVTVLGPIPFILENMQNQLPIMVIMAISCTYLAWLFLYASITAWAQFRVFDQIEKEIGKQLKPMARL